MKNTEQLKTPGGRKVMILSLPVLTADWVARQAIKDGKSQTLLVWEIIEEKRKKTQ